MRILSQDGKVDMPYEKVCLEVTDSGKIFAQGNIWGAEDNYIEVAKYSTESKARKAMDMLHGAYCGEIYMKCGDYDIADIDLSQELEKKIREEMSKSKFLTTVPNPVIECKIFQFPSDDEAEVSHD